MLYIIYQEDRDDGAEIRAANRDAHFAYLEQHRDILVLGGALIADDGIGRIGSARGVPSACFGVSGQLCRTSSSPHVRVSFTGAFPARQRYPKREESEQDACSARCRDSFAAGDHASHDVHVE